MLTGSIRLKIVLSYMVLLTLMIFFFCIILYDRLLSDLYTNLDSLLQSRAQGIADAIDTYWEVEKLEAQKDGGSLDALSKSNNINFKKIAQRWVTEESNKPELLDIIVQIFDEHGNIIASSKNIAHIIVFPRNLFLDAIKGKERFDTFKVAFSREKPTTLRVFTKPISEKTNVNYIVQVASPLTAIQAALEDLKGILFILLPLTILFTGLIGFYLAKITLRPVEKIVKAVRQITAQSLKLRVPVPRSRDEIQGLAVTFNDMLERLEQAFTVQRHFIQDASHELKTPLTILKGEIGVTLQRLRSSEEYEAVLRSNLEEIERISKIVENLLILARFDDKEIIPEAREFDLPLLLQDIVRDMAVLAVHKSIEISCLHQGELSLCGDRNYLRQVFINILDNAIKYTPDHGTVTVEVSAGDQLATVAIHDTGIGIPEHELPRIFDRFYRIDKARSSVGFGLGLSIAKSIVEAHHGTITVSSGGHQGATFTVELPRSAL